MSPNSFWTSLRSWVVALASSSRYDYVVLPPTPVEGTRDEKLEEGPVSRPSHPRSLLLIGVTTLAFIIASTVLLIAALTTSLPHTSNASSIGSTVRLSYGTYTGGQASVDVNMFLGLRFALPPVDDLRWRAPIPPASFESTQNATAVS